MTAPFIRGDVEQLREWARRLRREATCSVVEHHPRDCGELAALLETHLGEVDMVTHARTCGCRECLAPEEAERPLTASEIAIREQNLAELRRRAVAAGNPYALPSEDDAHIAECKASDPRPTPPSNPHVEQPMPRPEGRGELVFPRALESCGGSLYRAIRVREAIGLERYGQSLRTHNGRDALRDAREELADAYVYLTQCLLESVTPERKDEFGRVRQLVWCVWNALEGL